MDAGAMTDAERMKRRAAEAAVALVQPGMRLGLGTGSTARHFVDLLGARQDGLPGLRCVPTSEATFRQAQALGLPLATLDDLGALDLTVDGADELDEALRLIKGGGGALLREKIVAAASARMVVIADESKKVSPLGAFPLPVEIVPFAATVTRLAVERACAAAGAPGPAALRRDAQGQPVVTDNGGLILDCRLGRIADPERLAAALDGVVGVVEHGLFIGLAGLAFLAGPGGVAVIERKA